MNRTDRLFAIAQALHTAGPTGRTAASLAERFEVSVRTIKRDMAALSASGIPLTAQDGRGGGYQLRTDAQLAPLHFSVAEASAVAIALAADPELPFSADGEAALHKLLSAMTKEQRRETADVAGRVWMRTKDHARRSKAARVLDDGLRLCRVTVIDYTDGKGVRTRARAIEPMAFARTKQHWNALAYCHSRQAGRWFRLDRVHRARLTKTPFVPRDLAEVFGPAPDDARPVRLR